MPQRRLQMVTRRGMITDWWRAGGAPKPIAVYQPIGAASLEASYVNLVNPGTYDAAPGVAPTWASGTGWGFNGVDQYLTTGVVPAGDTAFIYRFSNVTIAGRIMMGVASPTSTNNRFFMQPFTAGGTAALYSNSSGNDNTTVGPGLSAGVMALAGTVGYRNGVAEAIVPGTTAGVQDIYLGGYNLNGTIGAYGFGNIQSIAIYPTSTNHPVWVPAVSAATGALTG